MLKKLGPKEVISMKRDILSYMNSHGKKQYTKYQVSAISTAIPIEAKEREEEFIKFNTRTRKGKELLNRRVADIANRNLDVNSRVTPHDVWVFKRCRLEEYQARTGKCAWGLKEYRRRLGYDENTGLELESD